MTNILNVWLQARIEIWISTFDVLLEIGYWILIISVYPPRFFRLAWK
jgi:hypothetical protein